MKKIKGYEVHEDGGKRLLGTLDLIVELENMAKDKHRARRNRKSSRLMAKWLRSLVRSYGIAADPFKMAVLRSYNIANGREEDSLFELEELRGQIARIVFGTKKIERKLEKEDYHEMLKTIGKELKNNAKTKTETT